jgi:hypothetical protein
MPQGPFHIARHRDRARETQPSGEAEERKEEETDGSPT